MAEKEAAVKGAEVKEVSISVGPNEALLILVWLVVNVALALYLKWLLTDGGVGFPILICLVQQVPGCIAAVFMFIQKAREVQEEEKVSGPLGGTRYVMGKLFSMEPRLFYSFVAVSALFCTSIITGNAALSYIHLSTVTMLKTLAPVVQMLSSYVIEKRTYSKKAMATVPIVVVGSLLTSMKAPDYHELGYILAFVALLSTAVYNSLCAVLLQDFKMSSIDTWVMNSLFGTLFMLPLFALLEMPTFFLDSMNLFELFWKMTLNVALAAIFCILNFQVIKVTSSVYNVMLCIIKLVAIVAISVYLNPIEIPIHRYFGFFLGIVGFVAFSAVTRKSKKNAASPPQEKKATSAEDSALLQGETKEEA